MLGPTARIRARHLNRLALQSRERGDEAAADRFAESAVGLMGNRNKNLSDAVIRVEALLTRSGIASAATDHRTAIRHLVDAAALLEEHPASRSRDLWLAEALTRAGDELRLAGQYPEAGRKLAKALGLPHWNDLEPLRKAAALNAKGILCKDTGRYQEAANLYAEAFELTTAALGPDDPEVAALFHNLAGLAHVQGNYTEAEPHIRAALEIRRRNDYGNVTGMAADTSVLGAVLAGQGRLDEAETALREALQLWNRMHGSDHYEVAVQLNNLASVQQRRQEYAEAEAGYTHALEIKRRVLGPHHPEVAALLNNLASLEAEQGRRSTAAAHYDEAIAILRQTLGSQHPNTKACIANRRLLEQQRPDPFETAGM